MSQQPETGNVRALSNRSQLRRQGAASLVSNNITKEIQKSTEEYPNIRVAIDDKVGV